MGWWERFENWVFASTRNFILGFFSWFFTLFFVSMALTMFLFFVLGFNDSNYPY